MGLQWAINNDIDVVNMSLGYRRDSPATRRAIEEAAKAGVIMVASVGNHSNYDDSVVLGGLNGGGSGEGGAGEGGAGEGGAGEGGAGEGGAGEGGAGEGGAGEGGAGEGGAGEGGAGEGGAGEGGAGTQDSAPLPLYSVMYPARYPDVIAVGASTNEGKLAAFSNSGPEMDVMAPGVDILSADITNGHVQKGLGSASGTSMAAPYVTAAVAMMLSLDPTLNADEIREILRQTAHSRAGEPAGDLNLSGALTEVMARFVGKDSGGVDRKELEDLYRETLKQRIESTSEALWD
jgi:subtilisin family serine protease